MIDYYCYFLRIIYIKYVTYQTVANDSVPRSILTVGHVFDHYNYEILNTFILMRHRVKSYQRKSSFTQLYKYFYASP